MPHFFLDQRPIGPAYIESLGR